MAWSPRLTGLCFSIVCLTVAVHSESSTCFIQTTQNYGFCKYGCCGTSLDVNQRCCDKPDVLEWIIIVWVLGSLLGLTWLICAVCLVHKAYKIAKKPPKVHPSKKKKKKEKKAQFVDTTTDINFSYNNNSFYKPESVQQQRFGELNQQRSTTLKSNLKNTPPSSEQKAKKERNLYPVKRNTEFTQVSYQPSSRSSGVPEWQNGNQARQNEAEYGRHGFGSTDVQSPDSYY